MRRYRRKNNLSDADRQRLDFTVGVFGPGIKETSLCATRFIARYRRERGVALCGGMGSLMAHDPDFEDISLVEDPAKLPLVIGGVGFGEFLGRGFVDRYVLEPARVGFAGTFMGIDRPETACPVFEGIDLDDRTGSYHIFGGSGFTFLVDERKLDGRPVPRTWADILDPVYRDVLACGFNIDDINEIPLVYLYRFFGSDGVAAFADNLAAPVDTLDMMRTTLRGDSPCAVYLVPHFFAVAAPHEDFIHEVWPEDGALLSPFYLLKRRISPTEGGLAEELERRSDDIVRQFFFGDDLASTLAGRRMFHVGETGDELVDGSFGPELGDDPDRLAARERAQARRFKWVGWDWLLNHDIIEVMRQIDSIVVPRVLDKHPDLRSDIGCALWNG